MTASRLIRQYLAAERERWIRWIEPGTGRAWKLALRIYLAGVGLLILGITGFGLQPIFLGWYLLGGLWSSVVVVGKGPVSLLIYRFTVLLLLHFPLKWGFLLAFPEIPRLATSAWIDLFVITSILHLGLRIRRREITLPKLELADVLFLAWIGLGFVFFFAGEWPILQRIYGVRMTYYPCLFYVIGRLVHPRFGVQSVMSFGIRLVVILAAINTLLLILVPQSTFRAFHSAIESAPTTFWLGKHQFVRMSSFVASPVEFGSILVLAILGLWLTRKGQRVTLSYLLLFLFLIFNLFSTASTGAIFALIIAWGAFLLTHGSFKKLAALFALAASLFLIPQFNSFILNKINFLEIYGRSAGGVKYLLSHPNGTGVGASGHSIVRFMDTTEEGFFTDVAKGYWAFPFIKALYDRGWIAGCSTDPLRYCPEADLTRIQLAVLLTKALSAEEQSEGQQPAGFVDIKTEYELRDYVDFVAARGLMAECPLHPGRFCPTEPVSRAEIAVTLVKAASWIPRFPSTATFQDVPPDHAAFPYVERLYGEGITGGCLDIPALLFCPDRVVTRAQMAVYTVKLFNVPYERFEVNLLSITDSWYVKTAVETGLIGLITFLAFLSVFIAKSFRVQVEGSKSIWILMTASFLVGFSLQAVGSNVWDFFLLPHWLWFGIGSSISLLSSPSLSGRVESGREPVSKERLGEARE